MDVAADDAIVTLSLGAIRRGLLEALNVPEAGANAELDSLYERPVGLTHAATDIIHGVVQSDNHVVQRITQARKPRSASYDPVEPVPMRHEQTLSPHRPMNPLPVNFELTVEHFGKHRETRIVIAGNVDQARAGTTLGQQRPDNVGVIGTPEEPLAQTEGVDDVTYQHDALGVDSLEKLRQLPHARSLVSKVDVGQEQRANFDGSSMAGLHTPRVPKACVDQMTEGRSIFYVTEGCGNILESESGLGGDLLVRQVHAAQRKVTDELTATPRRALNLQLGAVALEYVFDDSETQT